MKGLKNITSTQNIIESAGNSGNLKNVDERIINDSISTGSKVLYLSVWQEYT